MNLFLSWFSVVRLEKELKILWWVVWFRGMGRFYNPHVSNVIQVENQ